MMINSSALLFVFMLDESVILFFCSVSTAIRSVGKILECILNLNHLSLNMLYVFYFILLFFLRKKRIFSENLRPLEIDILDCSIAFMAQPEKLSQTVHFFQLQFA